MKVVILIGLPGSGKSTFAKSLEGNNIILSSDNYFTDKYGNYNWTIEEAHKGHKDCLCRFIEEIHNHTYCAKLLDKKDFVIVDNTNVRIHDVSPYIRIAQAYGFDVEVKYMNTDIDVAKSRNVQDVAYDRMQKNFEFLIETWPKDFPKIEFINGSIDDGYPDNASCDSVMPIYGAMIPCAYGCLTPEDQTEFDVVLADPGMNRVRIIRWVRENTDLLLLYSKKLVDNAPQSVLIQVSKYEAEEAKRQLEALGAKVEIR